MAQLKLTTIDNDKAVRMAVELPAALHRDLVAYGKAMAQQGGAPADPQKLIAPMLQRFIASDRGFASIRRQARSGLSSEH